LPVWERVKILANLTANTKNCGQITLNTKPHSDPLLRKIKRFLPLAQRKLYYNALAKQVMMYFSSFMDNLLDRKLTEGHQNPEKSVPSNTWGRHKSKQC